MYEFALKKCNDWPKGKRKQKHKKATTTKKKPPALSTKYVSKNLTWAVVKEEKEA